MYAFCVLNFVRTIMENETLPLTKRYYWVCQRNISKSFNENVKKLICIPCFQFRVAMRFSDL